ncbi:MAG: lipoate--protein ligase family protein [Planctomycetota bacterium]|nr:MAG: lipoate--protein ligase family protein [Planctomycetota bacterium]REJ96858.1 MAG: lipoate--protein ligase family protein [Planctomycetota bacterium]
MPTPTASHESKPAASPLLAATECRYLVDPPLAGERNMAVDETLLDAAIAQGTATLRFYQWREPTLSLGYFQTYDERHEHLASRDCAVVRRTTGGGAIVHDRELTYSFAAPLANQSRLNHSDLVSIFHYAASEALALQGASAGPLCCDETPAAEANAAFLCFQRRERGDVVSRTATPGDHAPGDPPSLPDGEVPPHRQPKLLGSAQRRRQGAILQHGSLLLAQSAAAPELPGLRETSGREIDVPRLIEDWSRILAARLGLRLVAATLGDDEMATAEQLATTKFASSAWLRRR